ncbi:MAG: Gfo/Idh/MocA family oxidoreductase [Verrucomicrobiota bacterium]
MKDRFQIALVGCGSISKTHAKAIAALSDSVELAFCVDLVEERAASLAEVFQSRVAAWSEVLASDEVDAVIVATSSGGHGELTMDALRAGKHVLVEKPMEVTSEVCRAMNAVQQETGNVLSVVSQHRFDPASQHLYSLVDEGDLGQLFSVEARVPWYRTQAYYDEADWRGTQDFDGGCLRNQGIHTLDLMLWIAGPVKRLWSVGRQVAHQRIDVFDHLTATLEFENGIMGSLTGSTCCYPGFPARLECFGLEGSVILEGDEIHTIALRDKELIRGKALRGAWDVAQGGTSGATQSVGEQTVGHGDDWIWGNAHCAQIEDFVKACQQGTAPGVTGHDGEYAIRVIEAIHESASSGNVVEVKK